MSSKQDPSNNNKSDKSVKLEPKGDQINEKSIETYQCGGYCIGVNPGYAPYCPLDEPDGRMGWGCAYATPPALALVESVGRG